MGGRESSRAKFVSKLLVRADWREDSRPPKSLPLPFPAALRREREKTFKSFEKLCAVILYPRINQSSRRLPPDLNSTSLSFGCRTGQ